MLLLLVFTIVATFATFHNHCFLCYFCYFPQQLIIIIDTKYGVTISNLSDDTGTEQVRIKTLLKKHGIKTDRSGNITQQKVFDLWQPEDKQFLKDFTTNAKYENDYIQKRVENSLGENFDKNQWVNC